MNETVQFGTETERDNFSEGIGCPVFMLCTDPVFVKDWAVQKVFYSNSVRLHCAKLLP